jgi:hypothetical protein
LVRTMSPTSTRVGSAGDTTTSSRLLIRQLVDGFSPTQGKDWRSGARRQRPSCTSHTASPSPMTPPAGRLRPPCDQTLGVAICVSEGLVEQIPSGGFNHWTWESRRPEAAWVRFLSHSTLKQHQESSLRACHSCLLQYGAMGAGVLRPPEGHAVMTFREPP